MLYRVTYKSMTAFYGPSFIEAESEYSAKVKFAGSAFNKNEFGLITAREISLKEMQKEMRLKDEM